MEQKNNKTITKGERENNKQTNFALDSCIYLSTHAPHPAHCPMLNENNHMPLPP